MRLDDDRVIEWREIAGVQPLSDVKELAEAEELSRDDPAFQEALAEPRYRPTSARSRSTPGPPGNFGRPRSQTTRLARCVAFIRPHPARTSGRIRSRASSLSSTSTRSRCCASRTTASCRSRPSPATSRDGGAGPPRDDLKPLEITQPDGPELHGRRPRGALAELAASRRLHAARGSRAARGRLSRRRAPPPDPAPRRRSPRWSCPTATRARRTTSRTPSTPASTARRRGHLAHARLRLPGRDPLLRRRRLRRGRRAGDDQERDLHARGGRRRALEAHRLAHGEARCAARAGS